MADKHINDEADVMADIVRLIIQERVDTIKASGLVSSLLGNPRREDDVIYLDITKHDESLRHFAIAVVDLDAPEPDDVLCSQASGRHLPAFQRYLYNDDDTVNAVLFKCAYCGMNRTIPFTVPSPDWESADPSPLELDPQDDEFMDDDEITEWLKQGPV